MRLNETYRLVDMLNALIAASDNTKELAKQMRVESQYVKRFTVYNPEGMLSTSPYARVTLTRKVSDTRWEGYMETSMYKDGPKNPVAVNCEKYTLVANSDFTQFTIQM